MLSKALLGFSVPDNQPSMTAHYKRGLKPPYKALSLSLGLGSKSSCRGLGFAPGFRLGLGLRVQLTELSLPTKLGVGVGEKFL